MLKLIFTSTFSIQKINPNFYFSIFWIPFRYVVYEVYPNNLKDISSLNDVVNQLALDIWSYPNLVNPGQIFVPGPQKEPFENALKKARIQYKAAIENIRE